jgi:hypothetical protein
VKTKLLILKLKKMKRKLVFRLLLVACTVTLLSFTQKKGDGGGNERRFWGWSCPSCAPAAGQPVGSLTCVSTYYVLGIGVNTATCQCTANITGGANNCSQCDISNLTCGVVAEP